MTQVSGGRGAPEVRRLLVVLFLGLVALGIAGMHTLGHPAEHGNAGEPGVANSAGHDRMLPLRGASLAVAAPVAGLPGGQDGFNPAAVCLAILAGVFALGMVVAQVVRRRSSRQLTRAASLALTRPRGPPPTCNRRLARLSVLRI